MIDSQAVAWNESLKSLTDDASNQSWDVLGGLLMLVLNGSLNSEIDALSVGGFDGTNALSILAVWTRRHFQMTQPSSLSQMVVAMQLTTLG
jgi:hypothetical protein